MDTLIIHLASKASKTKVKEAVRMLKGVKDVTDKITKADFESLADEWLMFEIKKAEQSELFGYEESKKRLTAARKKLLK